MLKIFLWQATTSLLEDFQKCGSELIYTLSTNERFAKPFLFSFLLFPNKVIYCQDGGLRSHERYAGVGQGELYERYVWISIAFMADAVNSSSNPNRLLFDSFLFALGLALAHLLHYTNSLTHTLTHSLTFSLSFYLSRFVLNR